MVSRLSPSALFQDAADLFLGIVNHGMRPSAMSDLGLNLPCMPGSKLCR